MTKTLAMSVSASAGMPSAAAFFTASSTRTMPSDTENSECILRWTKLGAGMEKFYSDSATMRHASGARHTSFRRRVHRAFSHLRQAFRGGSDRHGVLARGARRSGVVAAACLFEKERGEKRFQALLPSAGRGARLRRRPRLLAQLDQAHLGG